MRVKLSEYVKIQGVSVRTLWRRINVGTLEMGRSETGRVFVPIEQLKIEYVVVYARVSSSENKEN